LIHTFIIAVHSGSESDKRELLRGNDQRRGQGTREQGEDAQRRRESEKQHMRGEMW
jgi:hypothetical protein